MSRERRREIHFVIPKNMSVKLPLVSTAVPLVGRELPRMWGEIPLVSAHIPKTAPIQPLIAVGHIGKVVEKKVSKDLEQ